MTAQTDLPRPSSPRRARSRLDRPCDVCRHLKHLCTIPVRGEPCMTCKSRRKDCTFETRPRQRNRIKGSTSGIPEDSGNDGGGSIPLRIDNVTVNAASHASNDGTGSTLYCGVAERLESLGSDSPEQIHPQSHADDSSLDVTEDADVESHYLGSGAASGVLLRETQSIAVSESSIRQVSSDLRLPAFFVKHPTLLYGRTSNTGVAAFQAVCESCSSLVEDVMTAALNKLQNITLPAVPLINWKRLEQICTFPGDAGEVPHALLAGIIAHSAIYIGAIRSLHLTLWGHVLMGLEYEYRLPKITTLQLALLVLYSRPLGEENTGQSEIALSRAIGAAHLLGLHMDPSNWSLPQWERRARKRIWWCLLIQDKWRALLHGRPSNIHRSNHNVSLPGPSDADDYVNMQDTERVSYDTFIATCRLTLVVDRLLDAFYTVASIVKPQPHIARLATVECFIEEIRSFSDDLPVTLSYDPGQSDHSPASGVRSFQLSLFGLNVIAHRLLIDNITDQSLLQSSQAFQAASTSCQHVLDLMTAVKSADRQQYWAFSSSHLLFNTASVLLRIALRTRTSEPAMAQRAALMFEQLLTNLQDAYETDKWDISRLALGRIESLLRIVVMELPHLADVCRALTRVLGTLVSGPARPRMAPSTDSGFLSWMGNDVSWLNDMNYPTGWDELFPMENDGVGGLSL